MKLSILIPSRIEPKIHQMVEETESWFKYDHEIIVCNDRYGMGKGWAIRQALSCATGDIIAFIDGDMDIHPRMLYRLIPFINDYDIVIGRKEITGPLSRRMITAASRLLIWFMFGICMDTQTGIKIFNRNKLPLWNSDGWMFDVEILAKAHKNKCKIIEVPIDAHISQKVQAKSLINCIKEVLKVRLSI